MAETIVAVGPALETQKAKTVNKQTVLIPQPGMGVEIGVIFTPDLSAWVLEQSADRFQNRNINEDRVKQYGEDMAAGRWEHNGESIKFAPDGVLVDGYTRLTASFMHSANFITDVRFGVPYNAVATIDTGRPRTLGNALAMKNETTSTALAQGITWAYKYIHKSIGKIGRGSKISHSDAIEFLRQHPSLRDSIQATSAIRNKRLAAPGVLTAFHYLTQRANKQASDEFFEQLLTGIGYTQGSPVRYLRERLLSRNERKAAGDEQFIWMIHCWNKWQAGETIRQLKTPNEVPEIKGLKL